MKLSISNIAWSNEDDSRIYKKMQQNGFDGLEIAPTRIFPTDPYGDLDSAREWSKNLKVRYGFFVSSMQSIWHGRNESMFGTEEEKQLLLQYTKRAIEFAEAIACRNLVFGCPHNRVLPDVADPENAIPFFKELGDYASAHHTILALEPNPTIYQTNYINDTRSAIELIEKVNSKGFQLNLDVGTMIQNGEEVSELNGYVPLINHVHVSEPGLSTIVKHKLHSELLAMLKKEGYSKYISIEMSKQNNTCDIIEAMEYVGGLLGYGF